MPRTCRTQALLTTRRHGLRRLHKGGPAAPAFPLGGGLGAEAEPEPEVKFPRIGPRSPAPARENWDKARSQVAAYLGQDGPPSESSEEPEVDEESPVALEVELQRFSKLKAAVLAAQTEEELEQVKAIEAPGPRLAYAEGLARAVLCKVHQVMLGGPSCSGQQLRHMLSKVPEGDNSWILFTSAGGIWHPGRTGLFRNFTRQVPGPEKCLATVAPLIVRPVQAVPTLKSAVEVNRRLQLPDGDLEVMQEAKDCVQYCVRRALLADFLEMWSDTEFTDETQCMDQLWAFLVNDQQEKCYEIAVKQLYDGSSGSTPLWMYYAPWQRLRGSH